MNHTQVLYSLFASCNYASYLELGVYMGVTLDLIAPHTTYHVGVDIVDKRRYNHTNFFLGTTKQFFEKNTHTFDMVFIDADHNYKSVHEDFVESLKVLNPNGVIALHDTSPREPHLLDPGYCGDAYRIDADLNAMRDQVRFVTLPVSEAGLTLVYKLPMRHNAFT